MLKVVSIKYPIGYPITKPPTANNTYHSMSLIIIIDSRGRVRGVG